MTALLCKFHQEAELADLKQTCAERVARKVHVLGLARVIELGQCESQIQPGNS